MQINKPVIRELVSWGGKEFEAGTVTLSAPSRRDIEENNVDSECVSLAAQYRGRRIWLGYFEKKWGERILEMLNDV